jgi:hypothetical protein
MQLSKKIGGKGSRCSPRLAKQQAWGWTLDGDAGQEAEHAWKSSCSGPK